MGRRGRVMAVVLGAAACATLRPPTTIARTAAETPLQQQIRAIAADARGQVAVACALPGSTLTCDLNPDAKPPMQSVFKLPLAVAVLARVEQGKLALEQMVRFGASDRILPNTYSPLQEKFPDGNVDVSVEELLRGSVALSDNVTADLLLREIGGPGTVEDYIGSLGVKGFRLQDGEHGLHRDVKAQYRNWFTPRGAVALLRRLADRSPLTEAHTALLNEWMTASVKNTRLAGALPAGTVVAHKSGSSGVDDGLAHATNDIGLITLPDGRRLAIAVFLTDARADEATRDSVIARIARAAYDAAVAGRSVW